MKRSLLIASITAIGLAIASTFTACWRTVADAQVFQVYAKAKGWVIDVARGAVQMAKAWRPSSPAASALIGATAYVLKQVKRERPRYTATWRMAPST